MVNELSFDVINQSIKSMCQIFRSNPLGLYQSLPKTHNHTHYYSIEKNFFRKRFFRARDRDFFFYISFFLYKNQISTLYVIVNFYNLITTRQRRRQRIAADRLGGGRR